MSEANTPAVAPTLGDLPNKTPLDVLRAARMLIEKPEHWARHGTAFDARHTLVGPTSDEAVSFCAVGAVFHVDFGDAGDEAIEALSDEVGQRIASFNDEPGRTHAEVLAAFDKAIASLEQQ